MPTKSTGLTGSGSSTGDAGKTKRMVGYGAIAVGGIGIAAGIVFAVSAQVVLGRHDARDHGSKVSMC
ncbi:MAG: hypothetical protein NT062_17985 [Proteobacteria bacterium]|nr:hypothetical protein [Pseudomonadota bacterium]